MNCYKVCLQGKNRPLDIAVVVWHYACLWKVVAKLFNSTTDFKCYKHRPLLTNILAAIPPASQSKHSSVWRERTRQLNQVCTLDLRDFAVTWPIIANEDQLTLLMWQRPKRFSILDGLAKTPPT